MVIAHRGVSASRPENTLSAIRLAIDVHVPAIEVDVRRTRDGGLVVIHDETVGRTTNGSGRVEELTLAQIRRFDAGRGERVPALADVVREVRGRAILFLELKVRGLWRDIFRTLEASDVRPEGVMISFLDSEIAAMKSEQPAFPGGVLFRGAPAPAIETAMHVGADIVGFREDFIRAELVQRAHASHRAVLTWTVDSPARASQLAAMGVDYIASNAPDCILDSVRGVRR